VKNKTDFYAMVQIYAKQYGDKICVNLWEARKMALREIPQNRDLVNQINGALRIRFREIAPGLATVKGERGA
jgi:hypothetical protein